jgi:hypothetical protein
VGLSDLLSGRGSLFLVTGEPGIGKTRLADELGRSAATRGVSVHWGRAWEAGGAPSYWPFIQALRSVSRGFDVAGLASTPMLAGLLPELRHRIPELAVAPAHAIDRFQLFDAVSAFLHAATERQPLLLVLDDLHAADLTSLELLHFVVRDLRSHALMIVATFREAETRIQPELSQQFTRLAREACLLPLRRFDRAEIAEYVAQATGTTATEERVEGLHRQTEGNPLFLRELLQLGGAARQPDGIREVVRARLSLLSNDARRILEAAAILGREFTVAPLARLAEMEETEVRALLEPAAYAAIIEALEQPPRWRFTHVLLREGLYQDLAVTRRAQLHKLAARTHKGEASELAHHLLNAVPEVPVGEAADAALLAAQRAMDLLAFEDARSLYGRVAQLVEGNDEPNWFEAQLGLGLSFIRAADVQIGKKICHQAAELARRLGDGERFARAILASTYEFIPYVRDHLTIALLEEALALLPPGDSSLRARCMAQLAALRQPEPDTEGPIRLAREAVAMARRIGSAELLHTLSGASMAMMGFGDLDERLALKEEILRLAQAAGDIRVVVRGHLFISGDFLEKGDFAGMRWHLRRYIDLQPDLGHSRFRWSAIALEASFALWDGDFEKARESFAEAESLMPEDETRGASMAATRAILCCASERYDDLESVESHVRKLFSALKTQLTDCLCQMVLAHLYARASDRQRAAAHLRAVKAFPVFREMTEPAWLALVCDACVLVEDRELAERLHAAFEPRAQLFWQLGPITVHWEPPFSRQLGLLAMMLGRTDEAVARLSAAEARVAEAQMRGPLARVRYELACALGRRGNSGDRERAATLLEEAYALASELDQVGLLRLIAEQRTPSPPMSGRLPFALQREGDYWTVVHGDRTLRLRDGRGIQVLAQLVSNPGQELHVLQLASQEDEPGDRGDAGEILDQAAVQSYRQRLLDLREALEEAESFGDLGRADKAREEMEFLTGELARAVGLGGRARKSGNAGERARTAVQKRLRGVIQKIEEELPELGRHLDQTIRTGMFCGYLPDGRRG